MSNKPTTLILFDCDGTLVDSQGMILRAMEMAFENTGLIAPKPHHVRGVIGLSLAEAAERLGPELSAKEREMITEGYKNAFIHLRETGQTHEPLFPGMQNVLDTLLAEQTAMGVATGKSDRGMKKTIALHGLEAHFLTVQTSDRHPSKPHPSMVEEAMLDVGAAPETTVVIGDTSFDMEMAQNAGALAIGVDWGYHDGEILLDSGAKHLVHDAETLLEHIKSWKHRENA